MFLQIGVEQAEAITAKGGAEGWIVSWLYTVAATRRVYVNDGSVLTTGHAATLRHKSLNKLAHSPSHI